VILHCFCIERFIGSVFRDGSFKSNKEVSFVNLRMLISFMNWSRYF
jgi:hypothetical protein